MDSSNAPQGAETSAEAPRSFMAFASGYGGIAILRQIQLIFLMYFYAPPVGKGIAYLDPISIGQALTIAKIMDVLSDPIIGYLSDRTHHRWGKRLPYIVVGVPLWILSTILLFTPPVAGIHDTNFWYLTLVTTGYFISMTLVQIPYSAVLPEITHSQEETIKVSARMGKFFLLGVLLILVGGFPLAAKIGFPKTVILFSILAGLPLLLMIRELFTVEQHPVVHKRENFFKSTLTILRQRPFWTYLVGHTLFIVGYVIMLKACPYLATEVIGLSKPGIALLLISAMVSAIAFSPIVERLTLRFGKKNVMLGAMGFFCLIFLFWFQIGKLSFIEGTTTLKDVLGMEALNGASVRFVVLLEGLLFFFLAGGAAAVQMLVPNALVADLVRYDEQEAGIRREALIYGFQGGIEKNAVILANIIIVFCLSFGKDAKDPDGIYLIGPMAAITCLAGMLIFAYYPLGKTWKPSTPQTA